MTEPVPYNPVPPNSLRAFAETAQDISEARGSLAKIAIARDYLAGLEDERDLELAAQFLGEGAFSQISGRRTSVGHRTIGLCAADFCEIDYEHIFKPCRTATGSSSEAIQKLMENMPAAQSKRIPRPISLQQAQQWFEDLATISERDKKTVLLQTIWKQLTGLEIKYLLRIMSQGSLRIGFESRSIVQALARAFDEDADQIRYVHMISGSLGRAAVLASKHDLDRARFRLFHPLSFMLATPIESRSPEDLSNYVAEEKFDGMRCQLHTDGRKSMLFSRDLNDITRSFPEVGQFIQKRNVPLLVLDGEICVYREQRIQPFQQLQKRMGIKKPSEKVVTNYPVLFVAYDILFHEKQTVFDLPLTQRRELLETVCEEHSIPYTNQFDVVDFDDLDHLFNRAIAHGNEGLMIKRKDSTYEYGQRGKSWLKVKKPGGSLDTVIMYAHAGSGKRGGYYSDFTLGIRVSEDERYEEEFIPIGKAYGGYTDAEMKRLNQQIKELVVDRYGPTLALRPGIVVEVEFDEIQINKRTKAKYTLRLPRFKAIRWDLSPDDADTLTDVERIYNEKQQAGRLEQKEYPSFFMPGK
ncbi:MAG TPA: ATP-dependent DNA ligase, partial [Balneolales bacterium]|nr:ATP-dependent DNA ligase [Balneolales bacterium]